MDAHELLLERAYNQLNPVLLHSHLLKDIAKYAVGIRTWVCFWFRAARCLSRILEEGRKVLEKGSTSLLLFEFRSGFVGKGR